MPTVSQFRYAYIRNGGNSYKVASAVNQNVNQVTGWHLIPTQRLFLYFTPQQWYRIVTEHDWFRVTGIRVKILNMIPLTTSVAISQNNEFIAFNNTIYAMAYDDKSYSSNPVNLDEYDSLAWAKVWQREGVFNNQDGTVTEVHELPTYTHQQPLSVSADDLTYWDPLTDYQNVMELRPGKNAVQFSWEGKDTKTIRFRGTSYHGGAYRGTGLKEDQVLYTQGKDPSSTSVYQNISEQGGYIQKYVRQNFQDLARSEQQWANSPDYATNLGDPLNFLRTFNLPNDKIEETPLPNWFIKMIPIYDNSHAIILAQAQVGMVWELDYEVGPLKTLPTVIYPINEAPTIWPHTRCRQGAIVGMWGDQGGQPRHGPMKTTVGRSARGSDTVFNQPANVGGDLHTFATVAATMTTTTTSSGSQKRARTETTSSSSKDKDEEVQYWKKKDIEKHVSFKET